MHSMSLDRTMMQRCIALSVRRARRALRERVMGLLRRTVFDRFGRAGA